MWTQFRLDLLGDIAGYLPLRRKAFPTLCLVCLRPEMFTRGDLIEIGGDAQAVSRFGDGALKYMVRM